MYINLENVMSPAFCKVDELILFQEKFIKNLHITVHLSKKTSRNRLLKGEPTYINILFQVLDQGTNEGPVMYFHHSNK